MNTNKNTTTLNFPKNPRNAVEAIDSILDYATTLKASDIHCDPRVYDVLIRLRIDGRMTYAGLLPKILHEEFISRLKILAGARTDVHAIPQDGRWRTEIDQYMYNLRISFMPTYHGENAVIRLLPAQAAVDMSFAKLGFTPDHTRTIERALKRTHGLILVTGPTGSGKTTTLHSCLTMKAKEDLSIITLEDPIEYEIEGVRQVHIKHTHGVTFAGGLRSSLRQDPDVIMVGEIRDSETAQVAIHTALTGHLVLSTLHTNSAIEAIPRLTDMGIDRYILASTLRLVIAQRLVRTTCQNCLGVGCDACRYEGYLGRSIIAEIVEVDSGMKGLIARGATLSEYTEYILAHGFRPIEDDGQEKVQWGITAKEEVLRVLYE